MKRIAFALLSVLILVAMALPASSVAVLADGGDVDYIVISPENAFIDGGGEETQAYSAEAFDAQENSLGDVTPDTNFTIEPEAGGSWQGCTYTSERVGDWVVTGTHTSGKNDTAGLHVLETPKYPGGDPAPPEGGAGGSASSPAPSGATTEGESAPPVGGGSEPPHLEVNKTVSPETICLNDQATITLTVTGAGSASVEHVPLDVMLVIDRSGSMEGQKLTDAKAAAKTFVGLLNSTSDRSGLVSFSYWHPTWWWFGYWEARLNQNLTFDQSATNSSVDSLTAYGNTAMGEGIYEANAELINYGRTPPTIHAEVVLSDGHSNTGRDPVDAAQEAANNSIVIYTIGLGDEADNATMQNIADITGGEYYYAPNSTDLEAIYQDIAGELSDTAGTDVVVTEVLPDDVNYVNGSAVPPPNSTSGRNLTWELGSISMGDTRTITFNVTFDYTGYQPVDVYPDTRVNYTNYQNNSASEAFPETNITVSAALVANFTANNTNPYVNASVQFTDLSTGNATSWSWDVDGGGEDYSTQNVTHTYSAPGNYTVNLTVENECGNDTESKLNYITVEGAIERYNLTTSSTSGGSVTAPGEATYSYNASEVVDLVAAPDTNYSFVNWTGNVSTIANVNLANTNITMNDNYTIVANFEEIPPVTYNLTVISDGCCPIDVSGAVSDTVPAGGNKTFTGIVEGGSVTVSADDSGGCCGFVNWSDAGAQTHNITMDDDKSVTAYCSVPSPFTINATAGANGNIAPSGAVAVNCGADQTFNITADACYEIEDVLVDGSPVGVVASYTFTNVTANHTISATFAIGTYTITATAGANGNISPSGAVGVNCGADQTFNITADACYEIEDVLVDGSPVGVVASYTFTNVTANHTISATFAIGTYTITATAGANGNIAPSGAVAVNCGADQTFNITADACYEIEDVLVDGSPVGVVASYTFTNVTANHTISATFAIGTYTITATAGANGNISPSGAVGVNCGADQTFNITADACYEIEDVLVDGSPVGVVASYTFTNVTANHTISATFAIGTYTITATAGANGNIAPSGAVAVNCGADQTFNITAGACYEIEDVLVDGSPVGAVASYTFTNVTANHTISATFAIRTYTITATAGANGNIAPSGAVAVNCGADQTFNITADACYEIEDVLVDGSPVGVVASYTFTNVTANHTISATFAIRTYTITATAGANGNIAPSGAVAVNCGADQTFNITAGACYEIEDVLVDGSPVGVVASYTFTNVTANHTISATFAIRTYTINATAGANGNIAPSGAVAVNCGADQTFNITAGACYEIEDVLVDGSPVGVVASYTFTNVTANHTISATFAIRTYTINATAGANGNIAPSGAVAVNCGADQTFNITAGACYEIEDVLVDGSPVGVVASYTFTNVTANHTISATFAIGTYTITATAGANGNIAPSGAVAVNCGADQTFNITADACYEIEDVLVDGSPVGVVASYTFTNVTANHTISATFAIRTYTINATAGANGNIAPSGAVAVNCGADQTFNITADACYEIEDVLVDGSPVGVVASYTFTNVTANHTISATFAIRTYTITATAGANGNIAPSGAVAVNCGADQTFNITADACYEIEDVLVDGSPVGVVASYTFTNVTANHTISATFAIRTYTITATAGANGNIAPSGAVAVNCGADQTFNITAGACYEIEDVLVDGSPVGVVASYTFTNVTANHTISATFAIRTYTITATAGANGNIAPSGAVAVNCGADQTFNITADACYEIEDVLVDGSPVGVVASYTFTNVTANHTISATFAIRTYTITATAGANGNIAPSGAVAVNCGADQTFNITAGACYEIEDVLVDGSPVGVVASYTFTNVTANHTISATFAIRTYTITATAGANGNIAPSGAVAVNCGADQTFNITAGACYEIEDVLVDGSPVGVVASYTFTNVTANHTISATFSAITCTLTVNVTPSGGGNVTVNGATPSSYPNSTTWICGDNVTLNAVVASGYSFDHWGGALSGNATPVNITMDSNKDVIAYFTHVGIHYNLTVNVTPGGSGDIEVNGAAPGSYPHSYTFNESELVNLTAVPAGGYCFVNWSEDLSGSVNPTDITMTSDKNVTAHFTPIYNLTVTSDGCCPINVSGAASGTVSAGGSQTFPGIGEGGSVTVSADDSAVCCEFDNWSDTGAQTHTITMDSDKSVTAYCSVPGPFTISASAGANGDISPSGAVVVNCGADQTFNITADACYDIEDVLVDGSPVGAVASYTFTNVAANHTISATFSAITYNLTISSTSGGSVTTPGEGTYSYNASEVVDLVATADGGYQFVNWTGNVGTMGDANSATTNITMDGNYSIVANFKERPTQLSWSPSSFNLMTWKGTNPPNQTLDIWNSGGGILNWSIFDDVAWISESPTNGSLVAGEHVLVTISFNTSGLAAGDYSANITITGSGGIIPIILKITPGATGMRDLPGNNLMPNCTYPGDTFDVYVNFTSPEDDFNAIGLTDLAPDGWAVQVNKTWCSPNADEVRVSGNEVEIAWYGPYANGTNFSALYKVTVPETADPGINTWPLCGHVDEDDAWLEYYINWTGPNETCIDGDWRMMITVPSYVTGETRDVNANPLPDVFVILKRGNVSPVTILTDESTPDYEIICYNTGGDYWLRGEKNGYFTLDTRVVGDKSPHNVNLSPYINWSTPELLSVGNVTDFEGDYGLVPKICDMSYALNSLNLWLFWPAEEYDIYGQVINSFGLSVWKAMQSVDSWQHPS